MRWGKKRGGDPHALEDRYRALARLIERRGFASQGLVLIEVDGGFVVRCLRAKSKGGPVVVSESIAVDELLTEIEDLPA